MNERRLVLPLLLRVALTLGAIFGVAGTAVGLWGLVRLLLSDGPFQLGEDLVAQADFLIVALPLVVLYVLACLTAGAASWALWRGRARSRILLTILLAEFVIGDAAMLFLARRLVEIGVSELLISASVFSVLALLGLWYLYRKASVVAYYKSIRGDEATARA